jgi:hypothetical protein
VRVTITSNRTRFRAKLKELGLRIVPRIGRGECLFNAIGSQLPHAPTARVLRRETGAYLRANRHILANFVYEEENLDVLIAKIETPGVWLGPETAHVIGIKYNVTIRVVTDEPAVHLFGAMGRPIISIAYTDGNHYTALLPFAAGQTSPGAAKQSATGTSLSPPPEELSDSAPLEPDDFSCDDSPSNGPFICPPVPSVAAPLEHAAPSAPSAPTVPPAERTWETFWTKRNVEHCMETTVRQFYHHSDNSAWQTGRHKLDLLLAGRNEYVGCSLFDGNPYTFWEQVKVNDDDPLISPLAIALYTLPVSEACCERCFSYLRMIRTKHRRRLNLDNIADHVFMKLSGLASKDVKETKQSVSSGSKQS